RPVPREPMGTAWGRSREGRVVARGKMIRDCRLQIQICNLESATRNRILTCPRGKGMAHPPMEKLAKVLRQNGLIRFIEHYEALFPNNHLKDLIVDEIGPDRRFRVK